MLADYEFDLVCIVSGPAGVRSRRRRNWASASPSWKSVAPSRRVSGAGTIPSKTFREAVLSFVEHNHVARLGSAPHTRYREIRRSQILGDESGLLKLLFYRVMIRRLLGVHAIGRRDSTHSYRPGRLGPQRRPRLFSGHCLQLSNPGRVLQGGGRERVQQTGRKTDSWGRRRCVHRGDLRDVIRVRFVGIRGSE